MHIRFSPVRSNAALNLKKQGDTLVVNDEAYDFSGIPEGAVLPMSAVVGDWLASDVERVGGVLQLSVRLPHEAGANDQVLFPQPVRATDGDIALPGFQKGTET